MKKEDKDKLRKEGIYFMNHEEKDEYLLNLRDNYIELQRRFREQKIIFLIITLVYIFLSIFVRVL